MSAAHPIDHDQDDTCLLDGCDRPARARGYCERDYRRVLRREQGVGGIEAMDSAVYKLRVWRPGGTQPVYYSNERKAYEEAAKALKAGTLRYFAKYTDPTDLMGHL